MSLVSISLLHHEACIFSIHKILAQFKGILFHRYLFFLDHFYSTDSILATESPGVFKVLGSDDWKTVNFSRPSCSCRDWLTFNLPCKHFFAVFRHSSYEWNNLPEWYRNQPRLTLDVQAVESHICVDDLSITDESRSVPCSPTSPSHDVPAVEDLKRHQVLPMSATKSFNLKVIIG